MNVANMSEATGRFLSSPLHEAFRRVAEFQTLNRDRGVKVFHLHVGEPGYSPPEEVAIAIERSFHDNGAGYGDASGLPELRSVLANKVTQENRLAASPEQIIVTPGSAQGLYALMTALAGPGDEILLPVPYWPVYVQQCAALGLTPRFYRVGRDGSIDFDDIERALSARTRALLVNSPANPSGSVISMASLERVLSVTAPFGTAIISDEAYEDFAFDAGHVSIGALEAEFGEERRVWTTYSFSKTFALTGLRVGYVVAPHRSAASILTRVQEACLVCPSTPAQHGACAAMQVRDKMVLRARAHMQATRRAALPLLARAGLIASHPPGGWYVMCQLPESAGGAESFAHTLLLNRGVGVAPGKSFALVDDQRIAAMHFDRSVRIALCGPVEAVKTGVELVCDAIDDVGGLNANA